MELVEKVARAIYAALGNEELLSWDRAIEIREANGMQGRYSRNQETAFQVAQAAIEATRSNQDELRRVLEEREAVVTWLRNTATGAGKMWAGEDKRCTEIRLQLVSTLLVNADAIARGDHRNPPAALSKGDGL